MMHHLREELARIEVDNAIARGRERLAILFVAAAIVAAIAYILHRSAVTSDPPITTAVKTTTPGVHFIQNGENNGFVCLPAFQIREQAHEEFAKLCAEMSRKAQAWRK